MRPLYAESQSLKSFFVIPGKKPQAFCRRTISFFLVVTKSQNLVPVLVPVGFVNRGFWVRICAERKNSRGVGDPCWVRFLRLRAYQCVILVISILRLRRQVLYPPELRAHWEGVGHLALRSSGINRLRQPNSRRINYHKTPSPQSGS
jgi:hypothetical protein